MVKNFLYGFVIGCIICGAAWFSIGRSDIREIRQSFDKVDRDFKAVQRIVSQVSADSDGFAREISSIGETSRGIKSRSTDIRKRLTIIDGDVRVIAGEVDKLEEWNRQSISLGRDLSDVAADIRKLNRESSVKK